MCVSLLLLALKPDNASDQNEVKRALPVAKDSDVAQALKQWLGAHAQTLSARDEQGE